MGWKLKSCSKKLIVRKALVKAGKQYAIDSHRRCSVKKVYLKISPNSQESTGVKVSLLIKLQAEADCGTDVYVRILWKL